MGKYFPRYSITTAKHAVKREPIKYLVGKVHSYSFNSSNCRKSKLYVTKQHFYILHRYFSEEIINSHSSEGVHF